jgi:hypothetical protein
MVLKATLHSPSSSKNGISPHGSTWAYILENTPLGGGKYQPMSFGGKNLKRRREKGGKCKRKRKKGKERERKRNKGERKRKKGERKRKKGERK